MPAILANASKFLLNSDYPFDKVLENYSGSFSASARYGLASPRRTTLAIDHTVGDWALIRGIYSTDNVTWLPFGVVNADTTGTQPTFQTVEVTAYCTTSQVVIVASNYLSSAQTIYYALQLISRD